MPGDNDPWADIFPREVPEYPLTAELLAALSRWEEQPHNREGSDKSWVEDAFRNARSELDGVVLLP